MDVFKPQIASGPSGGRVTFRRASVSFAVLVISLLGMFGAPAAAEPVAPGGPSAAPAATSNSEDFTIEDATDPLLLAWSVAMQPSYFHYREGRGSRGYIRLKSVAEYDLGFGLPLWTRLQWPMFEIDNTTGPVKAGVGDVNLLLLGIVHNAQPWGRFGIGPVFVFPAASHREMGRQSYQIGPAFGWSNKHLIEGWGFGFLGRQLLSYAGQEGRTGINRLRMQPFIIKYLSNAWYVETQPTITVNFESNTSIIPLNVTIGRLVSRRVNINLQTDVYPDWTNTPRYNWDLRMSVSYLFRPRL